MKKSSNIRNIIIVMLCITIIIIGIGFVYLSLKLDAKNKEENIFKVEFVKIEEQTPIKGGYANPTGTSSIINEGATIKFNLTLNMPQDELAYIVTLKNTGTLKAKIINLMSSPDYINDNIAKNYIAPVLLTQETIKDNILDPDEEIKIKIVASYGNSSVQRQMNISYQLTILATTSN